jgi:hypothetical protein
MADTCVWLIGAYSGMVDSAKDKDKPNQRPSEGPKPPAKPADFAIRPEVSKADLERFKSRFGLM